MLVKILFVLIFSLIAEQVIPVKHCLMAQSTAAQPKGLPEKTTLNKKTVLFAHGFGGTKTRRLLYTKGYEKFLSIFYNPTAFAHTTKNYLFDRDFHNVISFNFKDVEVDMGIYGSLPNPLTSHLAQQDDINKLHANLEKINDSSIIGFGVSRGAATWLTTLGTKVTTKTIAGVILESPFSTPKNTYVYNLIGYCLEYAQAIIPTLDHTQTNDQLFGNLFPTHSLNGIQPLDVVGLIDKNIPILLVHSHQDAIIPINQSREIYIKFKESGHQNVYLLELEQGDHAGLIWGPQGELFRDVVHSFYKKYNLPCNQDFACKADINAYQPSIEEVRTRITQWNNQLMAQNEPAQEGLFSACLNIFM